jgi:hypothetical protein
MAKWMAHFSGDTNGTHFDPRLVRCYDEGRREFPSGSNPFVSGTPQYVAWQYGYDNRADAAYRFEGST